MLSAVTLPSAFAEPVTSTFVPVVSRRGVFDRLRLRRDLHR
jgi:hypothetical protein